MSVLTPTTEAGRADLADLKRTFDAVYRDARGDISGIPWADGVAHPALVAWLNVIAPRLIRCGSRVAVIGCGLGDDARALASRGYDVTAFDCSATAIDWAKQIDPDNADMYCQADLFNVPGKWRHRFDLAVEINTVQALPPDLREEAMKAIAELIGPHGHVLVICRACDESIVTTKTEPPYPLTRDELTTAAAIAGLAPVGDIDEFDDDEMPPVRRLRALFARA